MTSTRQFRKGIPMLMLLLCLPFALAVARTTSSNHPNEKVSKHRYFHPRKMRCTSHNHEEHHHPTIPYQSHLDQPYKLASPPLNSCDNIGFEQNNFSGWVGYTGIDGAITDEGIAEGRHTITRAGFDPIVPTISTVAPGSNYSVKLGNDGTDYEVDRLTTSFEVTPYNTLFSYQFAVILEDPNHTAEEQPRFEIAAFDEAGELIPCTYYLVIAAEEIEGFQSQGDIRYRDWSTVSLDLSQYIGQEVTIRFTTVDCAKGGHFGYAYIDAECLVAELSLTCNDEEVCADPNAFCAEASSYTITAPPGFNNYEWSTGETTRSIEVNDPFPGAFYHVSFNNFTTGEFGDCMVSLGIALPNPTPPPVIPIEDKVFICQEESITLNAGEDFAQYNWSTGLDTQYIVVNNTGNYSVTVTDMNGCIAQKDIQVQKGSLPEIEVDKTDASCVNQSDGTASFTLLNNLEGIQVQWSNGANTPTVDGLAAGEYCLTVSDAIGCTVSDCIQINTPPPLSMTTETVDNICFGFAEGQLNISSSGGTPPYLHAVKDDVFYPSNSFGGLAAGEYTVSLQDANGCILSQKARVGEPPQLLVDAGPDLKINLSESIDLQAIPNFPVIDYSWEGEFIEACADCPDPTVRPFYSSTYKITVIDEDGCEAVDYVDVLVGKPRNVYIPNVFSPNNDSSNDSFFINASGEVASVRSFQIFSRWGELIMELNEFQPNDPQFGWDGRHKGKPVNPGVYVYTANIEFIDGVNLIFKGDVTLVR